MTYKSIFQSDWMVVENETDRFKLTIKDENLGRRSVTNDVENVVIDCIESGLLKEGMSFYYYDSDNCKTEIIWDCDGFVGFKMGK